MLATLPRPRTHRTSARSVRTMLLEVTYRLHVSKVVKRLPGKDGRRRPGGRLPVL